jgi:hypothetical protein
VLIKIAAILTAIPLSLLGVFVGTGIVLVDVQESGPHGHHIMVPVPIVLAQAAAAFVPAHKAHVDLGEARQYLPGVEKLVDALAEAPDGEYVRVEERDQLVVVRKVGDHLDVRVEGRNENVRATVPLPLARDVVHQLQSGSLRPAALVGSLHKARFTQLADVRDGDTHVSVRVF